MLSGLLLWLAFPPAGWWPLAWIAPVGWLRLIRREELSGKRPYGMLYVAGLFCWLLMIQWVRLPHWSTGFGWIALSLYLAIYIPLFVGATRVMVHAWRVPTVVAAPVVWVGLEMTRSYFLTGFALALLGYSQVQHVVLLQIADCFGVYGVSFVVMLVAAAVERMLPLERGGKFTWWPVPVGLAVVGASLGYGHLRLASQAVDQTQPGVKVALIQGSVDTVFDDDPNRPAETFQQYRRLSLEAVAQTKVDLVVWPESMFCCSVITLDKNVQLPEDWPEDALEYSTRVAGHITAEVGTPMLVGAPWRHVGSDGTELYNSAVLYDTDGQVNASYHKMHPVMFGEYIPLGGVFPWLYRLTPMPGGLTPGTEPTSMQVGGLRFSPCICFENTVPHLVRRQVSELSARGTSPDFLVTITNDGWFWGSSLLDLHLACGVFRAVELRRPMLIAANTGFSAWIDGSGNILKQGPRRERAFLIASPKPDGRQSLYARWGDTPNWMCLAVTFLALAYGRVKS